ncbi:hypothetical protein D3C73_885850 [compost metagenome]
MSRPAVNATAPRAVTKPLELTPTWAAPVAAVGDAPGVPEAPPLPGDAPVSEPPTPEPPVPVPPPAGGVPPGVVVAPPMRMLRADSARTSWPPISKEPPSDRSCPAATRSAPCVCNAPCAAIVTSPLASTSTDPPAPTMPLISALRPAASTTLPAACAAPSTARSRPPASRRLRAACTAALGAMRTSPAALTSRSPVRATRFPPTLTPTPASVPISRMLLAYMPPSAAVSSATAGAGPSPARAETAPVA